MIVCSKCGQQNIDGNKFCAGCGQPLASPQAHCASCGATLPNGVAFCPSCGAKVVQTPTVMHCSKCGAELPPGTKFCAGCGQPVAQGAAQAANTQMNAQDFNAAVQAAVAKQMAEKAAQENAIRAKAAKEAQEKAAYQAQIAAAAAELQRKQNTFISMAATGDVWSLEDAIKSGIDIETRDHSGNTALIAAARNNNPSVVNCLIENGANINAYNDDGETALIAAAKAGSTDSLNALLYSGLVDTVVYLTQTAKTVEPLNIKPATPVSATTPTAKPAVVAAGTAMAKPAAAPTESTAQSGTPPAETSWADDLIKSMDEIFSAPSENIDTAAKPAAEIDYRSLVDDKYDYQESDYDDLFEYMLDGNSQAVDKMLDSGADANYEYYANETTAPILVQFIKECNTFTENHVAVLDSLLNAGADPDAEDNGGNTPISYLASKSRVSDSAYPYLEQMLYLLICRNVDLNHYNNSGQHVLYYVSDERIEKYLRDYGASDD